ncbi:hypothetical protein J3E74DRAFT_414568 [Bipolaris maydis]|nr:hypothetical protein J3E74DRAFT_414568 [Bipolaris maydis]
MDHQHYQPIWPLVEGTYDYTMNLAAELWTMIWPAGEAHQAQAKREVDSNAAKKGKLAARPDTATIVEEWEYTVEIFGGWEQPPYEAQHTTFTFNIQRITTPVIALIQSSDTRLPQESPASSLRNMMKSKRLAELNTSPSSQRSES